MRREQIFISSVQNEFAPTRNKLASIINNTPYWSQFFSPSPSRTSRLADEAHQTSIEA